MKKWLLKSERGFTLVELMVVVAIIGILSAIAVPNFKKYQAKSKQSEAKIQLASLYNTEVGSNADWDTYATCLFIMGYEQSPRGYYAIGFATGQNATLWNAGYTGCTSSTTMTNNPTAATPDSAYLPQTLLAVVAGNKPAANTDLPTSTVQQNGFTAGAAGSISSTVTRDQWTISHTKALLNVTPGY